MTGLDKTAGAEGPDYDNLKFRHIMDGNDRDLQADHNGAIIASHPDFGGVGSLSYKHTNHDPDSGYEPRMVHVDFLDTAPGHRRRGVATQMMQHLESKFPGTAIDHGVRLDAGKRWAESYYGPHDHLDLEDGTHAPLEYTRDHKVVKKVFSSLSEDGHMDIHEWARHEDHQQRVYPVHEWQGHPSNGYAKDLCKGHVNIAQEHHDAKTMLGLDSGISDPHEQTSGFTRGEESHEGQCVMCKTQLAREHKVLQSTNPDHTRMDRRAPSASPYTTKAPQAPFYLPPSNKVKKFSPLPPSVNSLSEEVLRAGHNPHDGWIKPRDRMEWMHPSEVARHADARPSGDVDRLADSFRQHGWDTELGQKHLEDQGVHIDETHPVTLWHTDQGSYVEPGNHRARAAEQAGLKSIPVLVKDHRTTTAAFTPTQRVFTHTDGLDHRLFDGDKLRPEVRSYVLKSISVMWIHDYNNWSKWAKVYFAGSEASEWTSSELTGNGDFDVLVGVDYDKFRKSNPIYEDWTNQQITDRMNEGFRNFNGPVMLKVDGTEYGPFDRTTYVNPDSYDIRKIKPYAAYDVGADKWVVKPPHLPHWTLDDLPKPVVHSLRAADTYARAVLNLPEPERTQQGAALFEAWHSDRSRAFSDRGEGWYDIANLREKWLDQEGLWAELVNCAHRAGEGLDAAPADWSNTPPGYVATASANGQPIWITPKIVMGPVSGIFRSRVVGSVGEVEQAVNAGWTAIIPEGSWYLARLVMQDMGMSQMEIRNRLDSMRSTASRADDVYGSNDIEKLFNGNGQTGAPWEPAGQSKSKMTYDKDLVARSITHPNEFPVEEHDPRTFRSTQPNVTREGVSHYLEGREGTYGETQGDHRLGNDLPRVYNREDGQKLLLTGHHRAAAALIKGTPLKAVTINGPWGKPR